MNKIIKTRKDHVCSHCNKIIKKGTKCLFIKDKRPVFGDESEPFEQTGIEYLNLWFCDCINNSE